MAINCVATTAATQRVRNSISIFTISFSMCRSQTHSSCTRTSIPTQGTRQSGSSVYSWPGSSLGTTVVGDDLDVVAVRLSLYNCNTFPPQLQASRDQGRQRGGIVLDVHGTTSVLTHSGSARSVACGCATMVTPQTIAFIYGIKIENNSNDNLNVHVHVYQESPP